MLTANKTSNQTSTVYVRYYRSLLLITDS